MNYRVKVDRPCPLDGADNFFRDGLLKTRRNLVTFPRLSAWTRKALTRGTRRAAVFVRAYGVGDLLITNDSGPAHFATLSQIPTVTLYGPASPVTYGVLNPNAKSLTSDYHCSPCLTAHNRRSTACDDNQCLQAITVETVRLVSEDVALADARYAILGTNGAADRRMWSTFLCVETEKGWRISAIRNMAPAK